MEALEEHVKEMLDELRRQVASDFSALAVIHRRDRYICWKWVSGNLNERYLNIRIQHGQGIEGEVIKVGRGLTWNRKHSAAANLQDRSSILLTEKLESAFAVPVIVGQTMSGILLIGDRSHRIYKAEVCEKVVQMAMRLAGQFVDLI